MIIQHHYSSIVIFTYLFDANVNSVSERTHQLWIISLGILPHRLCHSTTDKAYWSENIKIHLNFKFITRYKFCLKGLNQFSIFLPSLKNRFSDKQFVVTFDIISEQLLDDY